VPEEKRQPELIGEEAEAAAKAERERLFESSIPRSDQGVTARLAESIGRSFGLEADKLPSELVNSVQALRDQLTTREPPRLDATRLPAPEE
jgi:hypothetical protein